jgi:hypothetical protein
MFSGEGSLECTERRENWRPPHPSDEKALHSTVVHPPMSDINVRQVLGIVNASSGAFSQFQESSSVIITDTGTNIAL